MQDKETKKPEYGNFMINGGVFKTMTELNEIENVEGLMDFLKRRGEDHDWYYHYTSLDSLVSILENKTFRLSWGWSSKLNDQRERDFSGTEERWKRLYMASFSYGAMERVAMWGLYGHPKELAVRICIPGDVMREWLESLQNKIGWMGLKDDHQNEIRIRECPEVCMTDLCYARFHEPILGYPQDWSFVYRNLYLFCWSSTTHLYNLLDFENIKKLLPGKNALGGALFTGRVKHQTWEYEQEVRLHCLFGVDELKKDASSTYMDVSIPKKVLKSMCFTWGPNVNRNQVKEIETSIDKLLGPLPEEVQKQALSIRKNKGSRFFNSLMQKKLKYPTADVGLSNVLGVGIKFNLKVLHRFMIGLKMKELIRRLEKVHDKKRQRAHVRSLNPPATGEGDGAGRHSGE